MVLNTNSENQQIGTSSPVRYEELKGSIHEELEQKRKLKFEPKVQVQDISLTGKEGACKRESTRIIRKKQLKQAHAKQINLHSELLKAFDSKDLESAKKLVSEVKNLNISYQVKGVVLPLLLRLFVTNACKDASWFEFYKDVLSEGGKIDLNTDVCSSGTALSYACRERNMGVAELLLEHGADVNKESSSGETPILIALKNNDHNLASLLFRYGAKIDVTLKLEQTIVAKNCNRSSKYTKETMEVLLQYTSPKQNTLMLMYFSNNEISINEDIEIVKLLLEKGADLTVKNTNGKTCKDLATEKGNTKLIDLFNQKLGIKPESSEGSFVNIPYNLTLDKIQDILNEAVNENASKKLAEVIENIQDYESQFICNFDDPEEAGFFMEFSKKVLNLQSQVRDQYVSRILMVLQPKKNDSRYSVRELLLLAIAANDELTEKYQDVLFAEENLSLLPLLVGGQRHIKTFIKKFPELYQHLKDQTIQLEGSEIVFFSVIALRKEQELLDKVFVNEDALQDLKEILQNNASNPVYGVLETASLVQNERFIKKILDVIERNAKQVINDSATEALLRKSFVTLLETAISQERLSVIEHLCKKCTGCNDRALQEVYKEALADDKVIKMLKTQILKSIETRGRREIYDLMLKTASSSSNIEFIEIVLDLVKNDRQLLHESLSTISENASTPKVTEQLQKYTGGTKDMTKSTEVLDDVEPREKIQKALEKCLESGILHKYSEFEVIENGRNVKSSCNGWSAKRRGIEFFIKPLNVSDDYSVQSFITEIIAGPLYRLALFGKSPKIWLIKGDKDQIYLGSEFLSNFNTFADLFKGAVTESKINPKNCSEKQVQYKFKEELRKSAGSSRQFSKFLAACLIFREFDFNLGNFGIMETNDPGVAEKKWAKVDHGLSFEYRHFDNCLSNISDCSEILKFYLQDRKQSRNQILDNLVKEILAELVDYNELSEELGNMCNFLDGNKALIEQLIDKQIADLEKGLRAEKYDGMTFTIDDRKTFSYTTESGVFATDQGNKLNEYFKELLYDQVRKAKEFSEELSKKNKDPKVEGCNSLDNATGSNARSNSSKAYPEVVVTESNSSDGENKKIVTSSIKFQDHNSTQEILDRKIAELKERKTFAKEEKNDILNEVVGFTQNFTSHNFREGKMPTNREQQVKSSLGQGEPEDVRNQLEKLQKELNEKTQALENMKVQLTKKKEELNNANQILTNKTEELEGTQSQLIDKRKEISELNNQVAQLTQEKDQLEKERDIAKQKLVGKTSELTQLTEERNQLEVQLNSVSQELEKAESKDKELGDTIQELIEGLKTQLNNKNKELNDANQKVAHLERKLDNTRQDLAAKTKELDETKAQFEGNERELDGAKKNVLRLTNDLRREKSNQQVTVSNLNGEITQLTQALEKTKKQLKESESENKELNEQFLEASTDSKRQGNYASVSFVLSGALAVGASLTTFHLAMCISLAVAALTLLAVGFYCSYKANTALSNVEVENGAAPTVTRVLSSPS